MSVYVSLLYVTRHAGLEWMLSEKGAVKSTLEEDPRKKNQVRDMSIRQNVNKDSGSESDWSWASVLEFYE